MAGWVPRPQPASPGQVIVTAAARDATIPLIEGDGKPRHRKGPGNGHLVLLLFLSHYELARRHDDQVGAVAADAMPVPIIARGIDAISESVSGPEAAQGCIGVPFAEKSRLPVPPRGQLLLHLHQQTGADTDDDTQ